MTDAKDCPRCGHPMMSGPIQPRRGSGDDRIASWYCANCVRIGAESIVRIYRIGGER